MDVRGTRKVRKEKIFKNHKRLRKYYANFAIDMLY